VKSYRKITPDAESFLAFPVLVALSRRPMNIREISRVLLLSRDTTKRRVYELRDAGYIVKRADDNRWVQTVSLQMAGVPQPTSVPGIGMQTPPVPGEPRPQKLIKAVVPKLSPAETRFKPAHPKPATPTPVSEAAVKLAKHFDVVAWIEGKGEAGIGAVQGCEVCKKVTPLRYGSAPICVQCAKVWGRADQVTAGVEVSP
jgi:hypothetical protein